MRMVQGLVEWLDPARAAQGDTGSEPMSVALQRVRHAVRPGSLVVIISDYFHLDEDSHRHLSRLRQHNDVVGCQILDPSEEDLPPGRYPITDGQQMSLLDTGRSGGRSRFADMSQHHADDPKRMFQRHQCGWITMRTTDDPVELLGRELRVLTGRAA